MENRSAIHMQQARSLAMTNELRQAIGLLRFTNREMLDYVAMLAEANPHILVAPRPKPEPGVNWLDLVNGMEGSGAGAAMGGAGRQDFSGARDASPGADGASLAPSPPAGLLAHVQSQIDLVIRDPRDRPIADAFAEALEPSGWLSCTVADIARDCDCTVAQAEAVLTRLQQIEPVGLFARSLAECLRLQAIDLDELSSDFACLLDNLPLLGRGDLEAVAARCGCSMERLAQMLRILRGMNPKPGALFDSDAPHITEPDLIVRKGAGGWLIELNRSNLPAFEVTEQPGGGVGGGEDALRAARWLERAVSRRNATTLKIAHAVVARQGAFLAEGPGRLRPLSFADVADSIGMHPSTVSRVTTGLLVATPRGAVRFRDFFSAALTTSGVDAGMATAALRHELRLLIAAEDPQHPMSDEDIARHFAGKGVSLARRTVAKYRGILRIPTATQRLRFARLNARA